MPFASLIPYPPSPRIVPSGPTFARFSRLWSELWLKEKKEVNASKEKTEEEERTQTALLKCVNQVREFMMAVDRTDNKEYFRRFNLTNFIHVGGREEKE